MKSVRTPLYNQIMEYLLRLISMQQIEGKNDFPSEISIALQFGVSRTTSRRAIIELTNRGFLVRKQGSGTKINEHMGADLLEELKKYVKALIEYFKSSDLSYVNNKILFDENKKAKEFEEKLIYKLKH